MFTMTQVAWILEQMLEEVSAAMQEVRARDVDLGEQQEMDNQCRQNYGSEHKYFFIKFE